jgi:ribosome biogenesis GTPase
MQGIIIENISNLYKIKTQNQIYNSTARGKLKKDDITPIVGDVVEFEVINEENKSAVIEKIHERKVYIKRPKMANLTQLVFVVSSKDPKPDLLLLDKQLAFAQYLNLKAIIVLNKIDLDDKKQFSHIRSIYEKIGYKVIETTANEEKGIDELKKCLKNNINAFSGNSGVGKSTLINAIFSKTITQEGDISKKNKRGKNTTTSIKLYEIDKNTYIADTPGFSTFDISEIPSNQLEKCFIEFKNELQNCEFVGCTHIKEEKCGIKEAVNNNKISKDRYERFCKIYNEIKEREERKW